MTSDSSADRGPAFAMLRACLYGGSVERYFAYGSNLDSARLVSRVASARVETIAVLDGYRWRCNKRGRDGSAKANIEAVAGAKVWGVVYHFDEGGLATLDAFEGGYQRVRVEVHAGTTSLSAVTYLSNLTTVDERPTMEYRGFLLAGVLEHELPDGCRARIEALDPVDKARREVGR